MKNQVAVLHRSIQLMVALSGCMNKALALPNVNLNVYKIRITQATKFFETHAPNNKIGVRQLIMGKQRRAATPHVFYNVFYIYVMEWHNVPVMQRHNVAR